MMGLAHWIIPVGQRHSTSLEANGGKEPLSTPPEQKVYRLAPASGYEGV